MKDRVLAFALPVILFENAVDIGGVQNSCDVIDDNFKLVRRVFEGDIAKDIPQDANGMRDIVKSTAARERLAFGNARACGKETIGYGLSVEVGKRYRRKAGNEELLECLKVGVEAAFSGSKLFLELVVDDVTHEARSPGELGCKALGGEGFWQLKFKESFGKPFKIGKVFEGGGLLELGCKMTPDCCGIDLNAVAKEPEIVKISQDDIRKGGRIAVKLLLMPGVIKIAGEFGFDITNNEIFAVPNPKIRVTSFGAFRQCGDPGLASFFEGKIRKKGFDRAVIGTLCAIRAHRFFCDGFQVGC